MADSPFGSISPSQLREAVTRRFYRRTQATGTITLPAVPGMIDEYVKVCNTIFSALGVQFTAEQLVELKTVVADQLNQAAAASQRSSLVISFDDPAGMAVSYHVKAEWRLNEDPYHGWVDARRPPLFGIAPDARVWALASEAANPRTHRVLDVGALTGRNTLALARRGHPVDAVELTPEFAEIIRVGAERESLDIRVIQHDIFAATNSLRRDYHLIVLSGVVADLRTEQQLRAVFELGAHHLAPGSRMVFNTFLTRGDYRPDDAARELGQQCQTTIFTRDEMDRAATLLPLNLVADDPVYEYEKTHLPPGAWPPTSWYPDWISGLDAFDTDRENSPIEMRWLVYQRSNSGS